MPNQKNITLATADGAGLSVYALIRRESDGYLLDDSDGGFAQSPADPYVSLTEHAVIKGLYERGESRTAWTDGEYVITAYSQSGSQPAPASDTVIATGRMFISSDSEVLLDAPVSSRATAADLTGALLPGVFQPSPGISTTERQKIIRGDAATLRFNLSPSWNLAGRLAYFIAKASPTGDNASAIVNRACTITDAANGLCEITLTPEETAAVGLYHSEIEVREADGTMPLTALQFPLIIVQDVRQ